jgi:3-methylfumaryl-CoA hydratase
LACIDLPHLRQWIGRTETFTDSISPAPLRALAATLDRDDPLPCSGDEVPPCWHWLFFLPTPLQSEIGFDGHPRRGGYLPPVPLARRMWAGSRLRWNGPLRVGGSYTRSSRIVSVDCKAGQTGPLVFVKVRHEIADESGLVLSEDQDIVYRDPPKAGDTASAGDAATAPHAWSREVHTDPVLLLRYSALTFNGHRIHYDRGYATGQEGYPGLVVHGPLLATLLLDLLRRNVPDARVTDFTFRAVRPTFDTAPFAICGAYGAADSTVDLWIRQADGALAMKATAKLA